VTIDWGTGRYERTADQLLPAARVVVETAAPRAGERVLDVGCGTGNGALLAAERGAIVVGVDPAARLLDVARARTADAGLDVEFLAGEAAALPVPDASFDLVLSVFAVIFAPDPDDAFRGMARALAPDGRLVMSAWIPGGPVGRMGQVARDAVSEALGTPSGPPPFPWHDPSAVSELASPHGLRVTTQEHAIAFTDESVEAFIDAEAENHPVAISGRRIVEERGGADALRSRLIAVLAEGNEDPAAFRATSRYVVHTLRRT
jgi:SAM-dependent methyltransferase